MTTQNVPFSSLSMILNIYIRYEFSNKWWIKIFPWFICWEHFVWGRDQRKVESFHSKATGKGMHVNPKLSAIFHHRKEQNITSLATTAKNQEKHTTNIGHQLSPLSIYDLPSFDPHHRHNQPAMPKSSRERESLKPLQIFFTIYL